VKSISLQDDLVRGCYEIDLDDDDLGDERDRGSLGQIGILHEDHSDSDCEECATVDTEIDYDPYDDIY